MRRIDTLKKNYEFKNVLNKGKFYRGRYVTIYINKNKEEKYLRKSADVSRAFKHVKTYHYKHRHYKRNPVGNYAQRRKNEVHSVDKSAHYTQYKKHGVYGKDNFCTYGRQSIRQNFVKLLAFV